MGRPQRELRHLERLLVVSRMVQKYHIEEFVEHMLLFLLIYFE